jgi:hypothetical protein
VAGVTSAAGIKSEFQNSDDGKVLKVPELPQHLDVGGLQDE